MEGGTMSLNCRTRLCLSVSQRPSNLGMSVHNAGYRALGLDYLYLAREATDVRGVVTAIRALGVRGCSVSMPFKEEILPFLDELDASAQEVGAVNTVVQDQGFLKGYNTDLLAMEWALSRVQEQLKNPRVLLLGAGGMARAVIVALRHVGMSRVVISNRNRHRAAGLHGEVINWEERFHDGCDLLINATSVGMAPEAGITPCSATDLEGITYVVDVVAKPSETLLIRLARQAHIATISGPEILFAQALSQFKLYTGHEPPRDIMWQAMREELARS
ncbi:MAG: shikimate 5-dehydrogenase [Nitrospirae bacterium]|nr:shikimate 5-dehydrogenase [Magnetococcales bacterium]